MQSGFNFTIVILLSFYSARAGACKDRVAQKREEKKRTDIWKGDEQRYMKEKDIKVKVTYTEGYQKRFTEACLEVLKRRELRNRASA